VRNQLHATFDALVLGDVCVGLGGAENLTTAEAEYRECLRTSSLICVNGDTTRLRRLRVASEQTRRRGLS
jgi:hypothetical protein